MKTIPAHLRRYIVEQSEAQYSAIDHSVWRFILRQLRSYLKDHGHPFYLEGLEKTGISTDRIPKISEISKKLEAFGWTAVPVSGFIPPAVFMEMQSLQILPIASDMRSLEHLEYTPAPDIVHEAAGHAPMLALPEYTEYLKKYAQVARKAIMSSEDLALYEAIRDLSDTKERPGATMAEIATAEAKLQRVSKSMSYVSEAAALARMNWWTAEYGLIGDLERPQIFGAGLLSSVGESKHCLSPRVKKIPLSLDCINTGYDITEPQPQLFVTPNFKQLSEVLDQMAQTMAFKIGGLRGLEKAIKSKTVNTVTLESGLQISGVVAETLTSAKGDPIFVRFSSPTQLSENDSELPGHSTEYHQHGYSTPIGNWKVFGKPPSEASDEDLKRLGCSVGKKGRLVFESGITVEGFVKTEMRKGSQLLLLTWSSCTVTSPEGKVLFEPAWGDYDMAVGAQVVSVFGGPADRAAYGSTDEFVAARVPERNWTPVERKLDELYKKVRALRETPTSPETLQSELHGTLKELEAYPADWLLRLEILELLQKINSAQVTSLRDSLQKMRDRVPLHRSSIEDGLALLAQS